MTASDPAPSDPAPSDPASSASERHRRTNPDQQGTERQRPSNSHASNSRPSSASPSNSHGLPVPPDLRSGPVVVGVDEATTCGRALRAAVFMSMALDRPLILVHVRRRSMPVIEGYVPVPEETEVGERIQDEVQEELVAALQASPDLVGADWQLVSTVGDAAAELARVAEDRDAALVVVGKRHTGFAELVHRIASGSVSRAMVAANKWPVLVVP